MSQKPFVHLHTRSEYSLLQASSRIKDLVNRAKSYGMSALGITDFGVMYGALELFKYCGKDIKPLLGFEAVFTVGSRHFKKLQPVYETHSMLLYAKTYKGYENLMKLSSRGFTEGFFQESPRIDEELFLEFSSDIVAILTHDRGRVSQLLRQNKEDEALAYLIEKKNQLGADSVYLEVVNHHLPQEREMNLLLKEISLKAGVGLVATNDTYFTDQEDSESHEVLMAIREKTTMTDPKRPRLANSQYWFKDSEAMYTLFEGMEEALNNTVKIAEMCNAKLQYGKLFLPNFPLPEEIRALSTLCETGEVSVSETILKQKEVWDRELIYLAESQFPLELMESEQESESLWITGIADRSSRPSEPLTGDRLQKLDPRLLDFLRTLPYSIRGNTKGGDEKIQLESNEPIFGLLRKQLASKFTEMSQILCPIKISHEGTVFRIRHSEIQDFDSLPARIREGLKEIPAAYYLRQDCETRIAGRYGNLKPDIIEAIERQDKENKLSNKRDKDLDFILKERLDFELSVIRVMGFSAYFLIVADFINASKNLGIPVGPGRGSAAGALVAYLTGITDICPLRYGLYFERFLNPERISMPDIDIDFCFRRREESIDYCRGLYGSEKVAHIVTFGRLKTKAVLKDVARVLDVSYQEANEISKAVPDDLTIKDLEGALEESAELRRWQDQHPQLFDIAKRLGGLARQTGIHAAGVVIAPDTVDTFVPVSGHGADVVTQYDGAVLETQGLLKMDFLGLSTLTVIQDTIELVKKNRGETIVIEDIPLDDPKVFKMLCDAHTAGLFQVDSALFQGILRDMQPKRFEDCIALVALGRPGPLGSGMVDTYCQGSRDPKTVTYPHPLLKDLLEETYGVILYQEQVMSSAVILAGYTMAQADQLRRAMGKKKPEEMNMHRQIFVTGALKKGIPEDKSNEIFDLIAKFAEYGFNKSHSACYGLICYQTCWLKANYPQEFMAAAMTDKIENQEQIAYLYADCIRMKIPFKAPKLNESSIYFSVDKDSIVYGLGAIKEVGSKAVESILTSRKEALFVSLRDFCTRVDMSSISKKVLENLIKVGALDDFLGSRAQKLALLDKVIAEGQEAQKARRLGQRSLFQKAVVESEMEMPLIVSSRVEELAWEKTLTGIYFSGHPMDEFLQWLTGAGTTPIRDILQGDMRHVITGGMITGFEKRTNKEGQDWIKFRLVDFEDSIDCVAFSRQFKKMTFKVLDDQVVVISGFRSVQSFNNTVQLQIEDMEQIRFYHQSARWKMDISLSLSQNQVEAGAGKKIREIAGRWPGNQAVRVLLKSQGYQVALRLADNLKISGCLGSVNDCVMNFGKDSLNLFLRAPDLPPSSR